MSTPGTIETLLIPIHCPSWRSFADTYVEDLARGALRIPHSEPLPLLSRVTLRVSLPDSVALTLPARVVQVITGPQAEELGGPNALALELLDLEGETKLQLEQLVEFARAQRERDDEQNSFAHTMLELSASLPPREIGLRLSQLPTRLPQAPTSTTQDNATDESGYRHSATGRPRQNEITRALSPSRGSRSRRPLVPSPDAPTERPAVAPSEPLKLKELLSNVAHKHYDAALRIANEMLEANAADTQARRWRAVCYARIARTRNDSAMAVRAYEAVLELDPTDREARDYVKTHQRTKRLESIPFGRFFIKKK